MPVETVGVILLVDGDDREVAKVRYNAPRVLRERVVHFENRTYTQCRRDGKTWVYQSSETDGRMGGTVGTDPDLEPL